MDTQRTSAVLAHNSLETKGVEVERLQPLSWPCGHWPSFVQHERRPKNHSPRALTLFKHGAAFLSTLFLYRDQNCKKQEFGASSVGAQ